MDHLQYWLLMHFRVSLEQMHISCRLFIIWFDILETMSKIMLSSSACYFASGFYRITTYKSLPVSERQSVLWLGPSPCLPLHTRVTWLILHLCFSPGSCLTFPSARYFLPCPSTSSNTQCPHTSQLWEPMQRFWYSAVERNENKNREKMQSSTDETQFCFYFQGHCSKKNSCFYSVKHWEVKIG